MFALAFGLLLAFGSQGQWILPEEIPPATDPGAGSGGTGHTICFYQSKVKVGATYYDCGTCSKVMDEVAKGSPSKCY